MDAVSEVLIARTVKADGISSMLAWSAAAHLVVLMVAVFVPPGWWGSVERAPETVMQISLGGAPGENDGGLSTLGGRPIQQVQPTEVKRPIEPVRPPAARTPEMVEPTKAPPKKVTPNKVDAKDPRSTKLTKGAELQKGSSVAETGGKGFGTGLSSGFGGAGGYLDIANFCCPEYLATMRDLINQNWNARQGTGGTTLMRFVIQKDGRIADISVEKSSGAQVLDYYAQRALGLTKLPPLPSGYPEPALVVHLYFEYQR